MKDKPGQQGQSNEIGILERKLFKPGGIKRRTRKQHFRLEKATSAEAVRLSGRSLMIPLEAAPCRTVSRPHRSTRSFQLIAAKRTRAAGTGPASLHRWRARPFGGRGAL